MSTLLRLYKVLQAKGKAEAATVINATNFLAKLTAAEGGAYLVSVEAIHEAREVQLSGVASSPAEVERVTDWLITKAVAMLLGVEYLSDLLEALASEAPAPAFAPAPAPAPQYAAPAPAPAPSYEAPAPYGAPPAYQAPAAYGEPAPAPTPRRNGRRNGNGSGFSGSASSLEPATPKQLAAIHTIARRFLTEREYRLFLLYATGVTSSSELTRGQASHVIDLLEAAERDPAKRQQVLTDGARLAATHGVNI